VAKTSKINVYMFYLTKGKNKKEKKNKKDPN